MTEPELQMPTRSQTLICGPEKAPLTIIMFHGYTSSPDEMRPLAENIANRFGARVVAPLLPGHGTKEEDLLGISFDQLLDAARDTVERETAHGQQLVLLGHSMGGYLALLIAGKRQPLGIILTTTPFILRPRFRRFWMRFIMRTRSFWDKEVSEEELEMRRELFMYPRMPGNALWLVHIGIRRIKKILPSLKMPILTIYNTGDPISLSESGKHILELSGHNLKNKAIVFDHDSHGLYYGAQKEKIIKEVVQFISAIV